MKALILTTDRELNTKIAQICAALAQPITVINALPTMLPEIGIATAQPPDLVLLDAAMNESKLLDTLERLGKQYPQAALVLLTHHQAPEMLIAAMRAGVREVVAVPLQNQELEQALERLEKKLATTRQKDGKVLSFMSCKGGSGATFLASNLAVALANVANKKTLLIDLNLQFGDAALYLSDLKPVMTLADVCAQLNRLDADLLESSLIRVSPNCGILAASNDLDPATEIRGEHIDVILQLARRHYDYIVFDIGRQFNCVSVRAFDSSDIIYPILQQSLPYLRDGRRLLDLFAGLGYRKEKIQLILNRHENNAGVSVADMERSLDQRIAHFVPNNFDVVNESINQGVPVLQLARSSTISKSLVDIVNELAHASVPAHRGMIRRLFDRNNPN
ncbi:MAG: AAA family ATPase [Burkholderiaceae bacterium]